MTQPRRDPPRHVTAIEPVEEYQESRRGSARERMQRRRNGERVIPKLDWSWGIIVGAIVVLIILISVIASMAGGSRAVTSSTWTAAPVVIETSQGAVPAAINIQPWDGKKRFTVLLLGIDKRPGDEGTGFRTDSM